MDKINSKHRWAYILCLGGVIVFWALASWVLWSEIRLFPKDFWIMKGIVFPIIILSWPAHGLCLEITGQGSGANALAPVTWWSFMIFFIQAPLLWLPMMVPFKRSLKLWPWVLLQILVFLLLFFSFWKYGNG